MPIFERLIQHANSFQDLYLLRATLLGLIGNIDDSMLPYIQEVILLGGRVGRVTASDFGPHVTGGITLKVLQAHIVEAASVVRYVQEQQLEDGVMITHFSSNITVGRQYNRSNDSERDLCFGCRAVLASSYPCFVRELGEFDALPAGYKKCTEERTRRIMQGY